MICRKCKKDIPPDSRYCLYCGADQIPPARATKKRGNGQGSVYKRGKTWTAAVTKYEYGKRYVKTRGGFEKKKDALEWLSAASFVAPRVSPTFKSLYDEWSALHFPTISKKKASIYAGAYKKCSALYAMKWTDIGLRHFQAVVNEQKETYHARRDLKIVFSLMGKYAIVAGYADRNLAANIKLPPQEKPHKVAFTEAEIEALWRDYDAGNKFTGVILLMIYTGMRYGELSTIEPQNIFLDDGYLLGGIKTEAGKQGEIIIVDAVKPLVLDLLLPQNTLGTFSDTTFKKKFNASLKRCGCQHHTAHECRHTTATMLAKAGVQPAIIKEIMRHTSYVQTMEYTHIDRDTKRKSITYALQADKEKSP